MLLNYHIGRFVLVRCVLEIWYGWFWVVSVLQAEAQHWHHSNPAAPNLQHTTTSQNKTTDVVIQQHSRKLLMMDILMSEICWAHKKRNKIASDINLVCYSSTITMMHGPINIRRKRFVDFDAVCSWKEVSLNLPIACSTCSFRFILSSGNNRRWPVS